MRFPGMDWMDRVIGPQNYSVFSFVNAHVTNPVDKIQMIPYIFATNNTYRLFNDQLVYNQITPSPATFKVLTSQGGPIPDSDRIATLSGGTALGNALGSLVQVFNTSGFDAGFDNLMQYDGMSLRAYLVSQDYTAGDRLARNNQQSDNPL